MRVRVKCKEAKFDAVLKGLSNVDHTIYEWLNPDGNTDWVEP